MAPEAAEAGRSEMEESGGGRKVMGELASAECRDLLNRHHFGRVAFVDQVGVIPMILPVNYLTLDDAVVFRTSPGSKLTAAMHGAPVAFEIDGVDEQRGLGWDVLVRGRLTELTDADALGQLSRTPLITWAPGRRDHYVRLNPSSISGRRISLADLPTDWWG